jgi:hypothetical protein
LRAFGFLLRVFSYLFHLAVSFFFLGLGIVSAVSSTALHLDPIGLPPEKALVGVFALGVVGLFSTLLALFGVFRYLFPLWAAFVVWLLFKGFFLSAVTFSGPATFRWAVLLTFAGLLAFVGALWTLRSRGRL